MKGLISYEERRFKKIIKLRSCWIIDKRIGNYKLPNEERLSNYITELVESQMKLDNLGIRKNGNLCLCSDWNWTSDEYTLIPDFEHKEICTYNDMERRIKTLVYEIIEES